jgi:hypothetical protein
MTFTVKTIHEDGLIDTSTTMSSSPKDLALAFVIYREVIKKYPHKKVFLINDVEYE